MDAISRLINTNDCKVALVVQFCLLGARSIERCMLSSKNYLISFADLRTTFRSEEHGLSRHFFFKSMPEAHSPLEQVSFFIFYGLCATLVFLRLWI